MVSFKQWARLIDIRVSAVDVRVFEREGPTEFVMVTEIDREVIVMGLEETITQGRLEID